MHSESGTESSSRSFSQDANLSLKSDKLQGLTLLDLRLQVEHERLEKQAAEIQVKILQTKIERLRLNPNEPQQPLKFPQELEHPQPELTPPCRRRPIENSPMTLPNHTCGKEANDQAGSPGTSFAVGSSTKQVSGH